MKSVVFVSNKQWNRESVTKSVKHKSFHFALSLPQYIVTASYTTFSQKRSYKLN